MSCPEPALRPERPARYAMVNVRMGHVVLEQGLKTGRRRAYFSAEPVAPVEEYWDGAEQWAFTDAAQSMQFDVRDAVTGDTIPFRELLGLMYWGCAPEDSLLHRIGDVAQANRVSIYVAITYEAPDGTPTRLAEGKVAILNALFNDRLTRANKKILVLPDLFDLYRDMNHGQIMIDFGLTAMGDPR